MSGAQALLLAKFNTPENKVQSAFRERNHVATSYKGPVFVVEDIYVPCAQCRSPVDPVTRIPVGRIYFHPQCLRCSVCDRTAGPRVFREDRGQPVCHDCHIRGFRPSSPLQSSRFANSDSWQQHVLNSITHNNRTPMSAFTQRQLAWQMRQQNVLLADTNVLVLGAEYGDDPSQRVAYINNPARVAARIAGRDARDTPSKQLLPLLETPLGGSKPNRLIATPKPSSSKLPRGRP